MIKKSLFLEAKAQVYQILASEDSLPTRRSLDIGSEGILNKAIENVKAVRARGYDTGYQCKILTTAGVGFFVATKIIRSLGDAK